MNKYISRGQIATPHKHERVPRIQNRRLYYSLLYATRFNQSIRLTTKTLGLVPQNIHFNKNNRLGGIMWAMTSARSSLVIRLSENIKYAYAYAIAIIRAVPHMIIECPMVLGAYLNLRRCRYISKITTCTQDPKIQLRYIPYNYDLSFDIINTHRSHNFYRSFQRSRYSTNQSCPIDNLTNNTIKSEDIHKYIQKELNARRSIQSRFTNLKKLMINAERSINIIVIWRFKSGLSIKFSKD